MANEKNLTHKLTVDDQRKGGKASGKVRAEKKTVQRLLSELLESECKDIPQFAQLAKKFGVESTKSVKELFTLVTTVNAMKKATLGDLGVLCELLGEQTSKDAGVIEKLDKVLENINAIADK